MAGSWCTTARSTRWARCCARGRFPRRCTDAAKDFEAAFIVANLDPLRAVPVLRVPGTGREPEPNHLQLDARRRVHKALEPLGGIGSPAGSCARRRPKCSVREWAIRQGWGGRPVRQEQAQGILTAALGTLAAHDGYCPTQMGAVGRLCRDE
jgi:hypothetical protein